MIESLIHRRFNFEHGIPVTRLAVQKTFPPDYPFQHNALTRENMEKYAKGQRKPQTTKECRWIWV